MEHPEPAEGACSTPSTPLSKRKKFENVLQDQGISIGSGITEDLVVMAEDTQAQAQAQTQIQVVESDEEGEEGVDTTTTGEYADDNSSESSEDDFISDAFLDDITDSDDDEEFSRDTLDGASEAELLFRRRDKIKKLMKLYKGQFRRIRDTLRAKHRTFIKLKQRGEEDKLFITDAQKAELRKKRKQLESHPHVKHSKSVKELKAELKNKKKAQMEEAKQRNCTFTGCKAFCMPLTNFCYARTHFTQCVTHIQDILSDTKQKLFTNCTYVNRSTGNTCNYPILISQTPPFCNVHVEIDLDSKESKPRKRKNANDDAQAEAKKVASSPKPDRLNMTELPYAPGNPVQFSHLLPRQGAMAPLFPRAPVDPSQSPKVTKPDALVDNKLIGNATTRPLSPFGLTPFFSYNSYPVIPFGAQGVQSLAQLQQHQQQLQSKLLQAKNMSAPMAPQVDPSEKKPQ